MIPIRDINPSGRFPAVTVAIILACTAAFLLELSFGSSLNRFVLAFALVPRNITYGLETKTLGFESIVAPFFTSMFLHGGWLHLIGNMWFLWIFGDNIEDTLGHFRYVLFYLLCGLAAGLTHYYLSPLSPVPTIGASGAIAGVLGAYLVRFPNARVVTLVPLGFFLQMMELPAWLMLGLWFVAQAIGGFVTLGAAGGGVAWWAHVGGFLAGIVLVRVLQPPQVMV
ncbi:MAG: rhomboid family intramembrane serine protease [Candidatus Eisenbacteria bacterium]|uniref:Rhomboid family intramembrane serine protease n=1 Tax=Eiseniibacteriota bacterium TaxID=2212470 RepID=A0A538TQN8_UNCEI|nr:MAG: rhomboid family intramembrane serine protease [Candidatus Eisenbacteria bacterium]